MANDRPLGRRLLGRVAGGCAALAVVLAPARPDQAQDALPAERGRVSNWASDVVPDALRTSPDNRGLLEASRVELVVGGGPVVVQWSLSYDAQTQTAGQQQGRSTRARVHALARLERDGVELARWTLGTAEAAQLSSQDRAAMARVSGTASALYVDQAPGSGRRTYVLKVWNEGAPALTATIGVAMRTMICEER